MNPSASAGFGGPYLQAAVFCEKVLREGDGVPSLIRFVDRWIVTGPAEEMPLTAIQATLFISFRSGDYRGATHIVVVPVSPSAQRLTQMSFPVLFEGDEDRGAAPLVKWHSQPLSRGFIGLKYR